MRLLTALLTATLPLAADAGDGPVQLLPAGEFTARDGRPGVDKKWRVSDAQGTALAAQMTAIAQQTPIVIDYEHQTLHKEKNGQPAPAAGWIKGATWLSGKGLVSDVDWNDRARASISAKEYRYISPVITWDEDSGVITGVHLAALTNYPALLGMDAVVAALNTQLHQQEPNMTLLAALLTAIGLPAATTEEAALASVSALKATADAARTRPALSAALTTALGLQAGADETAALTALTALKTAGGANGEVLQLVTALQGQVAALTAQANEGGLVQLVDQAVADGKFAPALRDTLLDMGRKDRAALSTLIGKAVAIPGLQGQSGGQERGAPTGQAALAADAEAMRLGFGLTPEQWTRGAKRAG